FGPDSAALAIAGAGNPVAIWNVRALDAGPSMLLADQSEVYALAFSGDGSTLASVGFEPLGFRYASVWKLEDLDAGRRTIRARIGMSQLAYTASSLIIDKTGDQLLIGSSDGTVRRWLPDEQDQNAVLFTASSAIRDIAISSRKWIAAADAGGTIFLYDMRGSGQEPRRFGGIDAPPFAFDLSPDGAALVTAHSGGEILRHPVMQPRQVPEPVYSAGTEIRTIAHSPDGGLIALGGDNGRVILIDVARREVPPRIIDVGRGIVGPLDFDPSGTRLLAADDDGLLIIDPTSGQATRRDPGPGRVVGLQMLAGGAVTALTSEGVLRTWSADDATASVELDLGRRAYNADFGPGGRWLAVSRSAHQVEVYDLTAPDAPPKKLDVTSSGPSFSAFGYPLEFSPNGHWLAFSSSAGVYLWQSTDWLRPAIAVAGTEMVEVDVAFTPDGAALVSGGGFNSPPKLFSMPQALLTRACARAGRNLTVSEWRRYWGDKAYQRTCVEWPLPDGLVSQAADAIMAGQEVELALDRLGQLWAAGLPHGDAIPASVDTGHRKRIATRLARRALAFFNPGSGAPDVPQGQAHLRAAEETLPDFNVATAGFSASAWNGACWKAALWGHAPEMLWACDLAVDGSAGEARAMHIDSRGVARAVTGDLAGAAEDLEA
ncbi:MAG: WD40 repeat domain-containing protein, partial [Pseudomonadota bacterium]